MDDLCIPGLRSPDWLKVKHRQTLVVRVEAGNPDLVRWGDWGWAVRLTLTYRHPYTRQRILIEEIVRVPQPDDFTLRPGECGETVCWGFLPNGRLRHPVWMRWVTETAS